MVQPLKVSFVHLKFTDLRFHAIQKKECTSVPIHSIIFYILFPRLSQGLFQKSA